MYDIINIIVLSSSSLSTSLNILDHIKLCKLNVIMILQILNFSVTLINHLLTFITCQVSLVHLLWWQNVMLLIIYPKSFVLGVITFECMSKFWEWHSMMWIFIHLPNLYCIPRGNNVIAIFLIWWFTTLVVQVITCWLKSCELDFKFFLVWLCVCSSTYCNICMKS
jgi:hypothetical protein